MYLRYIVTSLCMLFLFGWLPIDAQEAEEPPALAVILKLNGSFAFIRHGWTRAQPLPVGTYVALREDFVIAGNDNDLVILCPDMTIKAFRPVLSMDIIDCNTEPAYEIIHNQNTLILNVPRGEVQSPEVPYLVSPRSTLLRSPEVELVWNHPSNATKYTIEVHGNKEIVLPSMDLSVADVVHENVARYTLPFELEPDVWYTVKICRWTANGSSACTSDQDWASSDSPAFMYRPDAESLARLDMLVNQLGNNTPESYFAQAIVLSQPVTVQNRSQSVGYYYESILLLESLIRDHQSSMLAQSPVTYYQLGEFYRRIGLLITAQEYFNRAERLAEQNTEIAGLATLGKAMTATGEGATVLYDQTLTIYSTFLDDSTFLDFFHETCQSIGELCLELENCSIKDVDCNTWYLESP